MAWLFGKKKEKDEEELEFDELEQEKAELRDKLRFKRRLKDLNPENKKNRKAPQKEWSKKDRFVVLGVFFLTSFSSLLLLFSSYGYKLPSFPKVKSFSFKLPSLDFFKEETIILTKKDKPSSNIDQIFEKNQKIINLFNAETKKLKGSYSFYIFDIDSQNYFGAKENEVMVAASLIKLPVIYAFYMEEQKGNVSFDEKVKYVDNYVTYRDLIRMMCKKSDNLAFRLVRQKLGDSLIQEYINKLGLTKTSLVSNTTTPKEIATFFKEFWKWSDKDKREILDYLTDTIYEEFLPTAVPLGVNVAHKYGRETHVINDAGIVLDKKPFIIVFMTQEVDDKEVKSRLPEIMKLVIDSYYM